MAVIEKDGLYQYIDENGNIYILYPVTKLDNVSGTGKLVHLKDGATLQTLDGTNIALVTEDDLKNLSMVQFKDNVLKTLGGTEIPFGESQDLVGGLKLSFITESTNWVAPKAVDQRFRVVAVGGGGGNGGGSRSGGGGSGYIIIDEVVIPEGETVSVVCGAGGATKVDGGNTSFGSYVTANGGKAGSPASGNNGGAGGDGGAGGGGGAASTSTTGTGGKGGNGGTYGGGGGGGGSTTYDDETSQQYKGTGGAGGNGGTYGGGGGGGYGGGSSKVGAAGTGGAHGGNGGKGGYYNSVAGSGGNGNPFAGSYLADLLPFIKELDFECFNGKGGNGAAKSTAFYGANNHTGGGGGGGGYGGKGGNGARVCQTNDDGYAYLLFYNGSGGGGGGYGGKGGNGKHHGGGGGGGFFGNGGPDGATEYGGGGGGFYCDGVYGGGGFFSSAVGGTGGNGGVMIMYIAETEET